jgi:hypothetical protein
VHRRDWVDTFLYDEAGFGLINVNVISWCSHLFLPGTYWFAIVVKIQSVWLLLSINDYLFLTPLLTGLDYSFFFFLVCHGLFLCSRINVHILVRLIVYFITNGFFLVWCTQMQNSPCNFNTPCIGTETEMLSIESNRNTQSTCIHYYWDILKKIKSYVSHLGAFTSFYWDICIFSVQ